ncbi:MAG: hypothetical protein Kow002_08690 [Anaerolineales bacterium]
MHYKTLTPILALLTVLILIGLACNLPGTSGQQTETPPPPAIEEPAAPPETEAPPSGDANPPTEPVPTNTPTIEHKIIPSNSPPPGQLVYDVESSGTAPEGRAPYGDAYNIYRLERPFDQSMTYIPDIDIVTYTVSSDDNFFYVSIELIGSDPNNELGLHYGVELDLDADGFAEYIIWSNPPYTPSWTTTGVQVFEDTNRDTGGLSGEKSDAPLDGDGYDKLIFDGGLGDDPDLAWIRVNAGRKATVQFAFKKKLSGSSFMLGVLADTGIKDVGLMYYNDRYTEEEAGSPERGEKYYPLKALHSIDNACREAFGFAPTGYEPQLCPRDEPEPKPRETPGVCQPPNTQTFYCAWSYEYCCCTNFPGCGPTPTLEGPY